MERANFFSLLGLSIDPPENDPKTIEAAIKKKQAQWSKLRNHPTKGIQAKQYIDLIPEIKKIMLDPQMREKEAQAALERQKKKEAGKYTELDRHIEIRISKGFITDQEVSKLAKLHKLDAQQVQARILARENAILAQIDGQLRNRMKKGYITEDEITHLANQFNFPEDKIRTRIKGPIKKGMVKQGEKPQTLEKTIQKVINDNLKIVGKTTLYEFLGLDPESDLEVLQKAAREKVDTLLKAAKKDATVTAGGILAGQCVSLFKTYESKATYDQSLADKHLESLNSDIEVAGMDGAIRAEYFEMLVKKALEAGMSRGEAEAYIMAYCRDKQWNVEKPATPAVTAPKPVRLYALAAILAVLAIVGGVVFYISLQSKRAEAKYAGTMAQVQSESDLEAKIRILRKYLQDNSGSDYTANVNDKILETQKRIEDQKFAAVKAKADAFLEDGDLESAREIYEAFLKKGAGGRRAEVDKYLSDIATQIEERDFQKVKAAAFEDPLKRVEVYHQFLTTYPTSDHRAEIEDALEQMSEEYYIELTKALNKCEQAADWQRCYDLGQTYVAIYKDSARALEIKHLQDQYLSRMKNEAVFSNLVKKAEAKGDDFDAARQVYLDYLKAYPQNGLESRIEKQLAELAEKARSVRIAESRQQLGKMLRNTSGRFVQKDDGVFLDTRTGLMWSMEDAAVWYGGCVDYNQAKAFVKSLKAGGYKDWRLPTADELTQLYKTEPYFPDQDKRWYWSSNSIKKYAGDWYIYVETVSSSHDQKGTESRNSFECAHARAVRK